MTLTGLIIFLLIGAVAGWLAGRIMKSGGFGLLGNIVVGVIGSEIGGWVFFLLVYRFQNIDMLRLVLPFRARSGRRRRGIGSRGIPWRHRVE